MKESLQPLFRRENVSLMNLENTPIQISYSYLGHLSACPIVERFSRGSVRLEQSGSPVPSGNRQRYRLDEIAKNAAESEW